MSAPIVEYHTLKSVNRTAIIAGWIALSLLSSIPDIAAEQLMGHDSAWIYRGKLVVLAVSLLAGC